MTVENTHRSNRDIIRYVGHAAGLGVLGAEGLGHYYFKNKTTIPKALLRAGLANIATVGVLTPIERRLYRAANSHAEKLKVKEASIMYPRQTPRKYGNTLFKDFVKTAAEIMGPSAHLVPQDLAYTAFELYHDMPEKIAAALTLGLHDRMMPGMNKVAMEMVAANIIAREKQASLATGAKTLGKGLAGAAGKALEPALTAGSIYSNTKSRLDNDRPINQQGPSRRN